MERVEIERFDPMSAGVQAALRKRPYINNRGEAVIAVMVGLDGKGNPVYKERRVENATLRKDEWIKLDETLIESARERLVIVADLQAAGLVYPVGGLGVTIAEWEEGSEITDAEITMDGESQTDLDRQEFSLKGVPIPIVQKRFKIGERALMASRQRGAALDVTTGVEAARSVARVAEDLVFNGTSLGASQSAGNTYQVYGLTNFPQRATITISDWADDANVSPEDIFSDILSMIQLMETSHRHYGPWTLYIPGAYAFRFREDYKALGEQTLMERCLAEPAIKAIKVADKLAEGNVVMVEMDRGTIDLAMASDLTNIQWASGSGWTNFFQTYMAFAPRLKTDFDGRTGILHATVGT